MTGDTIFCSQCKKELAMKFIEIKDLVFCSNYCLDQHITGMGQKKFFRQYGDVFVPGEGKGWVPKYANDYIMMCARCPGKLSDVCHENTQISAAYHDRVGDAEEYRWCCHTVNALADILIDRSNGEELAQKIIAFADRVAEEKGHPGVITRDFFIALGRMLQE